MSRITPSWLQKVTQEELLSLLREDPTWLSKPKRGLEVALKARVDLRVSKRKASASRPQKAVRTPKGVWKDVYRHAVEHPKKSWDSINSSLGRPYKDGASAERGVRRAAKRSKWPWPPRNKKLGKALVSFERGVVPTVLKGPTSRAEYRNKRSEVLAQGLVLATSGKHEDFVSVLREVVSSEEPTQFRARVVQYAKRKNLPLPEIPSRKKRKKKVVGAQSSKDKRLRRAYEYRLRYPDVSIPDLRSLFGIDHNLSLSQICKQLKLPRVTRAATESRREALLHKMGVEPLESSTLGSHLEIRAAALLRIRSPRKTWATLYRELGSKYSSPTSLRQAVKRVSKKQGWVCS